MTLTEFICTEGIENGLGFHGIMIKTGYSIKRYDSKWDPLYL